MHNAQIAFALDRIGRVLKSHAWDQAEDTNLTPTQSQILARIASQGPSRSSALAADLGVSQPTISDAVTALVRKGHVSRARDPQDARAVRLSLTAQGQRLADSTRAPSPTLLAALDMLSDKDRGALQRGLIGLIRSLQEARAIPVQRLCVTCAHFRPHAHDDARNPHHCAFVDAAFGDAALRTDCGDHEKAAPEARARIWARFKDAA